MSVCRVVDLWVCASRLFLFLVAATLKGFTRMARSVMVWPRRRRHRHHHRHRRAICGRSGGRPNPMEIIMHARAVWSIVVAMAMGIQTTNGVNGPDYNFTCWQPDNLTLCNFQLLKNNFYLLSINFNILLHKLLCFVVYLKVYKCWTLQVDVLLF